MLRSIFVLLFILFNVFYVQCYGDSSFVEKKEVQTFIHMMVKKHHFKQSELVALFQTVHFKPKIIRQYKAPLEEQPWSLYERLFVNEWRIQQGILFWNKHNQSLKLAEKKYGVPSSIIVATLGIETKYGTKMGEHRVLDALSNLAFIQTPRAAYFRRELEQFLLLTRDNHLDPKQIMGSYAGAIGQPQFMPSSYRHYAVNARGAKKVDLINNTEDAINSVANYYKQHGWSQNQLIAVPVTLNTEELKMLLKKKNLTSSELSKYGIIVKKGHSKKIFSMRVIELKDKNSEQYWLGFQNLDVIKRYNTSDLYAMAVFKLSHYLNTLKERTE